MQIDMLDTKGLVVRSQGSSQNIIQGQLTRSISVLSAEVTLSNGTETDTTINIPDGALCLGFKIERLVDGAANVNITKLGTNAAGVNADAKDEALGAFTLANDENATTTVVKACPSASRNAPIGAIDLHVTHGAINNNGAKIRVSVMIEQFS